MSTTTNNKSDPTMRFHVYIGGNDEMYITRKAIEVVEPLSSLKVGQGWISPDESAYWLRVE